MIQKCPEEGKAFVPELCQDSRDSLTETIVNEYDKWLHPEISDNADFDEDNC